MNRRTVLKGAAWATPVILHAIAAPAVVASAVPAPYAGGAIMAINVGSGAKKDIKIYQPGPGPIRGIGDLAPGVRFGWIGASPQTQSAFLTFTPTVAPAAGTTGPSASTLFQRFGGMTISETPTRVGSAFRYTIAVAKTSTDPRVSYAGASSFTVRVADAAFGTYRVDGASGRIAEFRVTALTGEAATNLVQQPTY